MVAHRSNADMDMKASGAEITVKIKNCRNSSKRISEDHLALVEV